MDIGKRLFLLLLWLAVAGNVMIALIIFARVLSGLVSQLRTAWRSFIGPAHVNRPDVHASVIVASGDRGNLQRWARSEP